MFDDDDDWRVTRAVLAARQGVMPHVIDEQPAADIWDLQGAIVYMDKPKTKKT
ncbi:MAG: hypothetical protein RLP44_02545 [Aggregatilineales bacterium]